MSKDSPISWTHHTANPWHGCLKVSPGCENFEDIPEDLRIRELPGEKNE
jgi:protein gp37